MLNFIHLQQPDPFFETALSLEQITYAQRLQDTVYIYFTGISKPLLLRGQAAEVAWRVIKDNSTTIFDSTWSAAQQTKSAETLSPKEFGTSASE
ncbi:hypothetical protein I8748_05600 [Nostoc sp. CENA67]|uniref:Uncharacterized protein n=1 Tax=Amazonocrinis nigriterrae CENA67 TaxID=2794033 RepID=A0A8J7HL56_9NOST|nr:hypothetical protein [Amazonocrinis nigriterrae]MBH8561658.1 hypothetical protein [Amazonocrinis nigriterrae CENA67]